jgi:phage shock protein A
MPLLERVATLLRANVNDLIDKAEDPEKMLKQLLLDMENQLLQVKTQVAIAIADQHLLAKKKGEHDQAAESWKSKAVLAVGKGQDDLARAALDRSLTHTQLADGFAQQLEDQRGESDLLRSTFTKLQTKLSETRSRCELLIAQRRRTRALGKAQEAVQSSVAVDRRAASFKRYEAQIEGEHATNLAAHALSGGDSVEERFALLEREEEIESLLQDLKNAHPALPDHAA